MDVFERVFVARLLTMSRKRDCLLRSTRKFTFFFFFWRRIGATWIFHEFFFFVPCTHLLACFCSTCFPTAAFEMFSFDCDKKKSCVCMCVCVLSLSTLSLLHSLSFLHPVVAFLSHRIQLHQLRVCVCVCVFIVRFAVSTYVTVDTRLP